MTPRVEWETSWRHSRLGDVCGDDDDDDDGGGAGGDWIPRRRARGDARRDGFDRDDDDDDDERWARSVRVHVHSGRGTESGKDRGEECVMRDASDGLDRSDRPFAGAMMHARNGSKRRETRRLTRKLCRD